MLPHSLQRILPENILRCLQKVGTTINEVRLRAGQELAIFSGLKGYYVNLGGICAAGQGLIIGVSMLEDIVFKACERSVYAFVAEIARGSLTLEGGVRLGLCGTVVSEGERIQTQKNICGINIRIPHEVKGCSHKILRTFSENYRSSYNSKGLREGCTPDGEWGVGTGRSTVSVRQIENSLIIAPVYSGKTTVLRDIAANLNAYFCVRNILIIDERNEIGGSSGGIPAFSLPCCDIITNCPKGMSAENIIRSMSPEVLIMDEFFERELSDVSLIANSGIRIFASTHASTINEAINRFGKESLKKIFSRYFVLANNRHIGELAGVYDENFLLMGS